ncbi:TIGR02253 family HAD-type hydrolase [Candidatus Woesearchaeota archaeon]|nr:TIGR02253 family HAD-type hydrolase [Candidatus Woesearchaeota archaeon]
MIKAVIFDVDNTLIDFIRMKNMTLEAAASAMIDAGLKEKKEKIIRRLWEILDEFGYEDSTVFQKYLKKVIGKVDDKILANAINAYRRVRYGYLEPYPHVMSTLIKFKEKGVKLAILSDAPRLKAWIRLSAMRLDSFFDAVVAFEDTKKHKPARKPFMVVLKKLNLKPEECLMIGDRPERDIKGAKAVGIQTCYARYGNWRKEKTDADYTVDDFSEILKIVG